MFPIEKHLFIYLFTESTYLQKQFETLKKRYSRKKENAEKQNTSGKGTADIFKARRELEENSFLAWLDLFTHFQQTKANLPPSEDDAGGEILDEDLTSSNCNSKISE